MFSHVIRIFGKSLSYRNQAELGRLNLCLGSELGNYSLSIIVKYKCFEVFTIMAKYTASVICATIFRVVKDVPPNKFVVFFTDD